MRAIILGILMFMFLVVIHELGHFIAAKKTGVKVLEFGIGIPPKAFTYRTDKQGTEYTINRIPLGGFVRLKGENPNDAGTFHAADSFVSASLPNKLIILFAGIAVNVVAAWLLFSIAFMKGITPISILPENAMVGESRSYMVPSYGFLQEEGFIVGDVQEQPATIEYVYEQSLAAEKGLLSGDTILSIGGVGVTNTGVSKELAKRYGKSFKLTFERDGAEKSLAIKCPTDECYLGIAIAMGEDLNLQPIKFTGLEAFAKGRHEVVAQTKFTFKMLGNLGSNLISLDKKRMGDSVSKLSGPVGIVKVGEGLLHAFGIWMYLAFAGMISLALAIFNLLPIPALDGGRAAGVIIQKLGRMSPEKYFVAESYVNMFFFVVLMGLGVYIILQDLVRFWGVSIPFVG